MRDDRTATGGESLTREGNVQESEKVPTPRMEEKGKRQRGDHEAHGGLLLKYRKRVEKKVVSGDTLVKKRQRGRETHKVPPGQRSANKPTRVSKKQTYPEGTTGQQKGIPQAIREQRGRGRRK